MINFFNYHKIVDWSNRYNVLLIAFLFLYASQVLCQNTLSVNQFLADISREELVMMNDQKLHYLNNNDSDLPIIEKLDFRTETNDFDLRQQEYLVRVTPNSIRNIKTQRQYKKTERTLVELELELAWSEELKRRYDLLVDYVSFKEVLAAEKNMHVLYEDKVLLQERSVSREGFDVLDLIEARDELDKSKQVISDLEIDIISIERIIALMNDSNQAVSIDADRLLDVDYIEQTINEYLPEQQSDHPQLLVRSAQLDKDLLEYDWEQSKNKFKVGFIQAKYGSGSENLFRESFSVGIGFDIPISKSDNLDLTKYNIQIMESEGAYSNSLKVHERDKVQAFYKLKNLIQKHQSLRAQIGDSDAEQVLKAYSKMAAANPMALIKLRENTLKKEQLLVNLKSETIKTFIEYMDVIGQLAKKPRRNYMYKDESYF